ncbi:MAG: hypothetical protein NXI32_29020, partial [bacterium]|nr:hypothetical protein [bacterium]
RHIALGWKSRPLPWTNWLQMRDQPATASNAVKPRLISSALIKLAAERWLRFSKVLSILNNELPNTKPSREACDRHIPLGWQSRLLPWTNCLQMGDQPAITSNAVEPRLTPNG